MAVTEEGSEWRIRSGAGLLVHCPMSPERRAAFDREAEKERLQAERDAELRQQAAVEHRGELLMQGVTPTSVAERLAAVAAAADRQDRRDKAAEERYQEQFGQGRPGRTPVFALLAEAKAKREAIEAEAESTPVSEAELGRKFDKLKTTIENSIGRRLLR
jgi:hypothetical protein